MEITFEVARLRGKPLTETQSHGEKFLPSALPSPSSPCFQLCLLRSRSCRPSGCFQQATQPAPAGMCSAVSFVPHVCRIQGHRSRARYRHGIKRALDYCVGVVQCGKTFLKSLNINLPSVSVGYLKGVSWCCRRGEFLNGGRRRRFDRLRRCNE